MSMSSPDGADVDSDDQQRIEPNSLEKSDLSRLYIDAFRFGEVLTGENGDSPTKFADLVGGDYETQDMAATERFAKLSVNAWLSDGGLAGGNILDDPESIIPEEEELPATPAEPEIPPPLNRTESVSKLSDEAIVKLLVDEFGSLTTSEDDVEHLICEMDGCFFDEVAILVS